MNNTVNVLTHYLSILTHICELGFLCIFKSNNINIDKSSSPLDSYPTDLHPRLIEYMYSIVLVYHYGIAFEKKRRKINDLNSSNTYSNAPF